MISEKSQAELTMLQKEHRKAHQDEVFGGLSKTELAAFNRRAERIHVLERELHTSAVAEKISGEHSE